MDANSSGSITHWLEGLKVGESTAAQELWNQYFTQLVAVAHSRLRQAGGVVSGEDVALSALKSVMLGVQANRFPELTDRNSLWPLLVTITAQKSIDHCRRENAKKRSRELTHQLENMRAIVGNEPSPEFAIEVADEMERLVAKFDDPILRKVAQLKLEGSTNDEIAEQLSISVRTVIRKLNRIRQEWEEDDID